MENKLVRWTTAVGVALCTSVLLPTTCGCLRAAEPETPWKTAAQRGLDWLANQQSSDGHWSDSGAYPEAMTALGGLALLMEGSTLRDGKYAARLRRAVEWLVASSQGDGLILNSKSPRSTYMYGHGYAMLFLASVCGEECDQHLRSEINNVLTRAVLFSGAAQSKHGGWLYRSAVEQVGADGGDSSSTVTQMQGLRAARNAGIVVPKEIIDRGMEYLRQTTSSQGGVCYGWHSRGGEGSLALTAGAIASSFSAGEYTSDLVKRWISFLQKQGVSDGRDLPSYSDYMHFYCSQLMYNLDEDRYVKLFPKSRPEERLIWSRYRSSCYGQMMRNQADDGSWNHNVYVTATRLIMLQLDNAVLPIFQR